MWRVVRALHRFADMGPHPVQLEVTQASPRRDRLHVVIRIVFLAAVATLGCSSLYWVLYLAIPAVVAAVVARDGAVRYLEGDAPRIVRALRWIAGAYAYLWLLTDELPTSERAPAELTVDCAGHPTTGSALSRLGTSLPALVLLVLLSMVASILWVVGALAILFTERLPGGIADFITIKLRYQFRLVAYHLSLVESYPAIAESASPHAPRPGAA